MNGARVRSRCAGGCRPAAVLDRLPALGLRLAAPALPRSLSGRARRGSWRRTPARSGGCRSPPGETPREAASPNGRRDAIDCDVHCAPVARRARAVPGRVLADYVASSGMIMGRGGRLSARRPDRRERRRPGRRPGRRRAPRRLLKARPGRRRADVPHPVRGAPPPVLRGGARERRQRLAAGEWLDRDPRLRAGIAVPTLDPDAAVAEIERIGDDPRFVQVLLPVRNDAPYGNSATTASRGGGRARPLTVALHAWGRHGHAPAPNGLAPTYLEDYLSNAADRADPPAEPGERGRVRAPPDAPDRAARVRLRLAAALLWRFDKDWKGLWREVPWVKEKPSAYVAALPRDDRAGAAGDDKAEHARVGDLMPRPGCCCTPATIRTATGARSSRCWTSSTTRAGACWRQRGRALRDPAALMSRPVFEGFETADVDTGEATIHLRHGGGAAGAAAARLPPDARHVAQDRARLAERLRRRRHRPAWLRRQSSRRRARPRRVLQARDGARPGGGHAAPRLRAFAVVGHDRGGRAPTGCARSRRARRASPCWTSSRRRMYRRTERMASRVALVLPAPAARPARALLAADPEGFYFGAPACSPEALAESAAAFATRG